MSTVLWMNIPLMVLAFGLMAGIPLWLVLRCQRLAREAGNPQRARPTWRAVRCPSGSPWCVVPRSAGYEGRRSMRPLTGGANG